MREKTVLGDVAVGEIEQDRVVLPAVHCALKDLRQTLVSAETAWIELEQHLSFSICTFVLASTSLFVLLY